MPESKKKLDTVREVVHALIEEDQGEPLVVMTPDGKCYGVESIQTRVVSVGRWATVMLLKQDPEEA